MTNSKTRVAVKRTGIIAAGVSGMNGLRAVCSTRPASISPEIKEIPAPEGVSSRDMRRMSGLTRLSLYAAKQACFAANLPGDGGGIIIALTHGSTSYLKEFHDYLFDYGPAMASPNAFSNGVTNAPMGSISAFCGLRNGGMTIVGYENSGMQALSVAAESITDGSYEYCLAGAAEEYSLLVNEAYEKCGRKGAPASEAGVFMLLAHESLAGGQDCLFCSPAPDSLNVSVDAVVCGGGNGPCAECEEKTLSSIMPQQNKKPPVFYSKSFFGETFAAGAMISCAMACDMIISGKTYPVAPDKNNFHCGTIPVRSVLVISGSRSGEVLCGLFEKNSKQET